MVLITFKLFDLVECGFIFLLVEVCESDQTILITKNDEIPEIGIDANISTEDEFITCFLGIKEKRSLGYVPDGKCSISIGSNYEGFLGLKYGNTL